jgi:hypothetical protein
VRPERFELPTYCSGGNRSIHLSYGRVDASLHPGSFNRQKDRAGQQIRKEKTALTSRVQALSRSGGVEVVELSFDVVAKPARIADSPGAV